MTLFYTAWAHKIGFDLSKLFQNFWCDVRFCRCSSIDSYFASLCPRFCPFNIFMLSVFFFCQNYRDWWKIRFWSKIKGYLTKYGSASCLTLAMAALLTPSDIWLAWNMKMLWRTKFRIWEFHTKYFSFSLVNMCLCVNERRRRNRKWRLGDPWKFTKTAKFQKFYVWFKSLYTSVGQLIGLPHLIWRPRHFAMS